MIKLLALADIHGAVQNIPKIARAVADCDAVVLAGDITDFGGTEQANAVLSALDSYGIPLVGVPGNCDPLAVDTVLAGRGINAHGGCVDAADLRFVGVGGATPNDAGDLVFQDTLKKAALGLNGDGNVVLVTHQPAYGTQLDHVGSGRHTGSRAVRRFIEQYEPILAVSGHLHELSGTDTVGPTTLINPGPFRQGCYAVIEIEGKTVRPTFYQA